MVDQEIRQSRLSYIVQVMKASKIQGNPAKFVVLRNYQEIVDSDRDYTLHFPTLPEVIEPGRTFWINERGDDTKLVEVRFISEQPEGVVVKPIDYNVEITVTREDLRQSPIPLRPIAVRRSKLSGYIGEQLATTIRANRIARATKP